MFTADQHSEPSASVRRSGKNLERIFPVDAVCRIHGISVRSLRTPAQSFRVLLPMWSISHGAAQPCSRSIRTCCRTFRTIDWLTFTWISPDLDHDAHNGTNDQDALDGGRRSTCRPFFRSFWLSPPFQTGGNGVLLVTFDEGELSGDNECGGNPDPNNCGGHIWQVLIGPHIKRKYQSSTHYMQGSQLRMFCDLLGSLVAPGTVRPHRRCPSSFVAAREQTRAL